MTYALHLAASGAALLSLAQPALAQGVHCVSQRDLADATTYAMPLVIEGLQSACADTLPADSYLMNQGEEFAAGFELLRDAAWPGMRRVLVTFIERETSADRADAEKTDPAMGGVIQSLMRMEGDDLRPFVDAIATQMIAGEIKPGTCGDVESILPLLAPLPPENYGELVSRVLGLVADGEEMMPICKQARK